LQFDEKNGETTEPEKLPSIDDESNQLEVAEYVDDIYQFYWTAEVIHLFLPHTSTSFSLILLIW